MSYRATSSPQYPIADRRWSVESYGLEPVAEGDRHGKPVALMWVWFAANIGVVGIIYGAILTTLGLDLWQGLAVATLGTSLSFALVGVLGVAGKWSGAPMLGLSRVPFGRLGNLPPALVSWFSLLGWETVTAVVTSYAVLALLGTAFHLPPTRAWSLFAMLAVVSTVLVLSRLGHATIVVVQRIRHVDLRAAHPRSASMAGPQDALGGSARPMSGVLARGPRWRGNRGRQWRHQLGERQRRLLPIPPTARQGTGGSRLDDAGVDDPARHPHRRRHPADDGGQRPWERH